MRYSNQAIKQKPFAMSEENIHKFSISQKQLPKIEIKKAVILDVVDILDLINLYASANLMLPRGPQYLYENIRDFVIAADYSGPVNTLMEPCSELRRIVACSSLHVLWQDVAEIRALSIHPNYKNLGIARKLVECLIEEARMLEISCLVTFTLTEGFFAKLGFIPKNREDLPSKVWGECSRCPKYFRCDETAMAIDIR